MIKLIIERYDNDKLIKLFNKLDSEGYSPLWNDPYCQFVCKINNKNYKFTVEPNTDKIVKELIGTM